MGDFLSVCLEVDYRRGIYICMYINMYIYIHTHNNPLARSPKYHPLTKQVPLTGWIQILIFCGMVDFGLYRWGF
jgi:hypothetical protein